MHQLRRYRGVKIPRIAVVHTKHVIAGLDYDCEVRCIGWHVDCCWEAVRRVSDVVYGVLEAVGDVAGVLVRNNAVLDYEEGELAE